MGYSITYRVDSLTRTTLIDEFLELIKKSRNSLIRHIRVEDLHGGENNKKSDAGNFITRATLKSHCYEIRKLVLLFLTFLPRMFLWARRFNSYLVRKRDCQNIIHVFDRDDL